MRLTMKMMTGAALGLALLATGGAYAGSMQNDEAHGLKVGHSAIQMVGTDVIDADGAPYGEVHDVLLMADGALGGRALVVANSDGKLIAVRFSDIRFTEDGRVELDATVDQIAGRQAFSYDETAPGQFAPLGFGAVEPTEASAQRETYLNDWEERIDVWAEEMSERTETLSENAEARVQDAWSDVKREWDNVKNASARGWRRASESFESAYDSFNDTWAEYTN